MEIIKEKILEFVKLKVKEFESNVTSNNRSEATIYKTTINKKEQELYITSIKLDTENSFRFHI